MALVFPTNPIDGQLFDRYIYNDAKGVWDIVPDDVFPYYVGPTKPTSPKEGMGWFNTENAQTYIYYDDGIAGTSVQRTNLITNPSFETGMDGWSYIVDNYVQTVSTYAFSGTKSLDQLVFYDGDGVTTAPDITVTVGETYTASAYVYVEADMDVKFQAGGSVSTSSLIAGVWTRMSTSFTASSTTANISVYLPLTPVMHIFVDAVMLEQGSVLNDYFDGSYPGASWNGTAHASTSTLSITSSSGQWVATSGAVVVPNSNSLAILEDVALTSPADNDVVSYDTATSSWVNRNLNDDFVRLNPKTISETLNIPSGYNGTSAGPLTIADGVTVTIADGSSWSVV